MVGRNANYRNVRVKGNSVNKHRQFSTKPVLQRSAKTGFATATITVYA